MNICHYHWNCNEMTKEISDTAGNSHTLPRQISDRNPSGITLNIYMLYKQKNCEMQILKYVFRRCAQYDVACIVVYLNRIFISEPLKTQPKSRAHYSWQSVCRPVSNVFSHFWASWQDFGLCNGYCYLPDIGLITKINLNYICMQYVPRSKHRLSYKNQPVNAV